jgi:hypothetical protein
LAKFYKPARGSKNEFDNLVENKNLMCMNELDDKGVKVNKRIYGATGNSFKSIEVAFIPCIPKQITSKNKHLINKECLADLKSKKSLAAKFQESKNYLGRPAIKIVANT